MAVEPETKSVANSPLRQVVRAFLGAVVTLNDQRKQHTEALLEASSEIEARVKAQAEQLKAEALEKVDAAKATTEERIKHSADIAEQLALASRDKALALSGVATHADVKDSAKQADLAPLATSEELAPLAKKTDLDPLATTEQLAPLASKEDLAPLATADDLTPVAKSEELKPLASKADLSPLAEKSDLAALSLLAEKTDLNLLASKDDLVPLATRDDLSILASKDDLTTLSTKQDLETLLTRVGELEQFANLAKRGDDVEKVLGTLLDQIGDLSGRIHSLSSDLQQIKTSEAPTLVESKTTETNEPLPH